jgi:hypothetical protein
VDKELITPIIVAVIVSTTGPLLLGYLTDRARRRDKKEDYARQDIVADRAEEAARLLLEENKRVAEATAQTQGQLQEIHTLVNSNLTAAMQAELSACEALLEMKIRYSEVDEELRLKIVELKTILYDRTKATELGESQRKI